MDSTHKAMIIVVTEKEKKMFKVNDVVQFTEKHKWCGCFGIISDVKEIPLPDKGVAYIYVLDSTEAIEYVGRAILGDV